jgi:hypothetical protein
MYMRAAYSHMSLAKLQKTARTGGRLTEEAKGMTKEELVEYLLRPEGK